MSDTVSIKKSTAKKISATVLFIILLSVLSWFFYQAYLADQATLKAQISQLQNELANKKREAPNLNKQVTDLRSQLDNLEKAVPSKNNDILQLNLEIDDLNAKIVQANQTITDLINQIAEAEGLITQLEKIYPTPIYK